MASVWALQAVDDLLEEVLGRVREAYLLREEQELR